MKSSFVLTKFRKDMGLTQYEMADKIGISVSFYSKIEVGIRNPSFNFMTKLKKTFPDVETDIFFAQ